MLYTHRLALHRLFLGIVATMDTMDTLLFTLGSTDTYAGLEHTVTLLSLSAHSNGDTKRETQKHSLIFLKQSYELTNSSEDKVACNNFVI